MHELSSKYENCMFVIDAYVVCGVESLIGV